MSESSETIVKTRAGKIEGYRQRGLYAFQGVFLPVRSALLCLGEHNEYVYKQLLKVSDEEYLALEKEGHIGMDYAPEVP